MKKLIIVYVVLIIAVILLAVARGGTNFLSFIPSIGGPSSNATAKINEKTVKLLLADSDEERQKGLSGRDKLDQDQGMLFVFDQKGKYSFWMKEMKFAIDIIWIDENKVVHIVKNAQPPQGQAPAISVYTPDQDANYVLELNAGKVDELKITEGTEIQFDNLPKTQE